MSLPRDVAGRFNYGPGEYALRRRITDAFEHVARSYGYQQVETSALERQEYLAMLWGGDLEGDVFSLPAQDGQSLALRFDATLPCVRMYLDAVGDGPSPPRRWAMVSECFRRDPVGVDRRWSFIQLNAESFGYPGVQIDAEVVQLMAETLCRAGLGADDFAVHVNDRRLVMDLLTQSGGDVRRLLHVLDHHSRDSPPALFDALVGEGRLDRDRAHWLLDVLARTDERNGLERAAAHTRSVDARRGIESLAALLEMRSAANLRLDLGIVRGLDYYSGLVFECFPASTRRSALGAGGRYDSVIERLGGRPTPAVGMAIGLVPLLRLLTDRSTALPRDANVDYVIGCATTTLDTVSRCQQILSRLRANGNTCILHPGEQDWESLSAAAREYDARWALLIVAASDHVVRRDLRHDSIERLQLTDLESAFHGER
jgi:histidyl-tRNA synthetase